MIDSDVQSTEFVAQLLKDRVSELYLEALPDVQLTMSFGVTAAEDQDTPETLFKRADQALYRAKENGKNQVVRFEPPQA